jgi:hypothetical protein
MSCTFSVMAVAVCGSVVYYVSVVWLCGSDYHRAIQHNTCIGLKFIMMFIQMIMNFSGLRYIAWDYCCWWNRQVLIVRNWSHCRWKTGVQCVFIILCTLPFDFHRTKIAVVCVIYGFPSFHRYIKGHVYLIPSLPWTQTFSAHLAFLVRCPCLPASLRNKHSWQSLWCFIIFSVPVSPKNVT